MNKKSRFVHTNGSTIVHCPVCRGVVLKMDTVKVNEKEGTLASRCPHCYEPVTVRFVNSSKGEIEIQVDADDAK